MQEFDCQMCIVDQYDIGALASGNLCEHKLCKVLF